MNGECLAKSIIYQATVNASATNMTPQTYVGLTENTFKNRYANHKHSFNNIQKGHSTELSNYIWTLKDKNIDFNISWKILKHAKVFSNNNSKCKLCLYEKFFINFKPELATLNKRNELVSMCRHTHKFLLKSVK